MNGFITQILRVFGVNNSQEEETLAEQAKRENEDWRNGNMLSLEPMFNRRLKPPTTAMAPIAPVPVRDAITEVTEIGKVTRSLPPSMQRIEGSVLKPEKTPRIHSVHEAVDLFEKGGFGKGGGPRNREHDSEAVARMAEALRFLGFSQGDVTQAVRLSMNVLQKRELALAAQSLAMHRAGTVREETLTGDEILEVLGVWQMLPVAIGTTKQELVTLFK